MRTDLVLSAVIAATGVSLFLGLVAGLMRRYSSALANSLWRGALVALWVAPIATLAAEALQVNAQAVCVPLLPAESVVATPAAVPPEMVDPLRAVAQLSRAAPDTVPPTQSPTITPGRDRGLPSLRLLLGLVWAAGAAFGAALLVRDIRRLRALVRRSSLTADPRVSGWIARWSRLVGLRGAPLVAESPDVCVPTIVGCLRPRLFLQPGTPTGRSELSPVIVHELAHIRRADLLVHLLARVTRVIWWWNPAAFLIAHGLRRTAEEVCDDWAVALTGEHRAYAGLLVRWAEAAGVPASLSCAEQGRALIGRVERILQPRPEPRLHTPRWTRLLLVGSVGVAVLFAATLDLRAAPEEAVLEDFGEPGAGRWGGGIEFAEGEDGEGLGQWFAARNGHHLELRDVPDDWSSFRLLEFWMWSAAANGQHVMLLVYSHGNDPNGMDYFSKRMVIDWEGWRRVRIPLSALRPSRGPDWAKIKSLAFSTTGWDVEALEDTDLYLDEIRLLTELPADGKRPADVVSDFEEGDLDLWSGLSRETEHVTQGEMAGRWDRLTRYRPISVSLEMDWTPYQYFEFDCYAESPTGDRFILCILSMDQPKPKDLDYWAYIFQVDWRGWRHFRIPFRRLPSNRHPVGWDRVTGIHMYPDGWGMQTNPSPDTVLVFDDMRLTEGQPRDAPAGMVEDFEGGPWAWWWMDEGSVPPKAGDHCGQFVLHEGWRSARTQQLLTTNWGLYRNLKLWVYARALEGEVLRLNTHGDGRTWTGAVPLAGEGWREVTLPLAPNPGRVTSLSVWLENLTGNDEGIANRDLDPAAVLCLDDIRLDSLEGVFLPPDDGVGKVVAETAVVLQ